MDLAVLSAAVTGEPMEKAIAEALSARKTRRELRDYASYLARASARMRRRLALPPQEMADIRYFECRACGWNPLEAPIYQWFWALTDLQRREIVLLSRTATARFCHARR